MGHRLLLRYLVGIHSVDGQAQIESNRLDWVFGRPPEITNLPPALEVAEGTPVTFRAAITNFVQAGGVVPTPSVRSTFAEDIFLVLDELPSREADTIRLRVVIRPMVSWLWAGGVLMALGTALAITPTGRRRPLRPPSPPPADLSGPEPDDDSARQVSVGETGAGLDDGPEAGSNEGEMVVG